MAVVVLAAAAAGGLFGHGPLGRTEIVTAVPGDRSRPLPQVTLVARVAFDRYIRLNSPSVIRLSETVSPALGDYLDAVEIGRMTPRPEANSSAPAVVPVHGNVAGRKTDHHCESGRS